MLLSELDLVNYRYGIFIFLM